MTPVRLSVAPAVSGSVTVTGTDVVVLTSVETLTGTPAANDGGSLTAVTVSVNAREAVAAPSLTVTVIVAVPA